jgi:hypothetical protein
MPDVTRLDSAGFDTEALDSPGAVVPAAP